MNSECTEQDLVLLFREKDTKQKVINLFLHSADVSNPTKPWAICKEWAFRCLEEFFDQGDKEKSLGIPVGMLNDRTKVNRPFSQIGFLEFMIVPLTMGVVKLFPSLYELAENLQINLQCWHQMWVKDAIPADDEAEKVAARIERVCASVEPLLPKSDPIRNTTREA